MLAAETKAELAGIAFLTLSLLLAVVGFAGQAFAAAQDPAPVYGGHLSVGVSADPDGLDPHKTVAAATFEIARNIYDTLVEVDPSGRIRPGLARKWTVSADGLTWTFKLEEHVLFHNGRQLTSEDVKYSFERILDERTAHPRAKDYSIIESISCPDSRTVVFKLKARTASFLSNLAMGWAAIVPKEVAETGNLRTKPVGTGPFKLVEWVPNSYIKLEKFPGYFKKGVPYLDSVTFKILPEPSVRAINLRTGEVDLITWVPPQDVESLLKDPSIKVVEAPANGIYIIAINNEREPFNDKRVRQALNYAVDRKALIEGAQWGFGTPIGSHMPPVSEFYVDLSGNYPYDPQKARQLLAEAGYPNGFDTVISLPQPYDFHIRNGEVVASQLKKVGINAKLEIVEWGTWLDRIYFGRDYALTAIGHTGRIDPDPFLNRYVSDSKENYMNYKNPGYDALIREAAVTIDPARRAELYEKAQRTLSEDAVAIYLMAPSVITGMRANVYGYEVYPIDIMELRTVYKTRQVAK